VVFIFEFVRMERDGKRLSVGKSHHRLRSADEAKMLAAAMLKRTTFTGITADAVIIRDQKGSVLCEVPNAPRP